MATDTGVDRGNYLRICDVCLHRFHFKDLTPIGELKWACKDDAPGLTAMQVSRFNARARPLKVRPNRFAKGLTGTPTYQLAEGATFNFIASSAATISTLGAPSAAWAAIYLADIVNQNLRPPVWITTAKTALRLCLNYLLTQQYGAPTGITPAGTADNPRYGGIYNGSSAYLTSTAIVAGVAFVKGASALGDSTLLLAADRCATFVRHVQCGDIQASVWTVFPSLGGPYHVGGLASAVVDGTGLLLTSYLLADVAALWFLSLLVAARSPSKTYGDGAATAFFTSPTAAPLSQMISELGAFAAAGARDSTANGSFVTGLSATKPQSTYTAAISSIGGNGLWTFASTIASDSIALATLGVFMASGLNAQVTSILTWLASFSPNPANASPAQRESLTIAGITGAYDPALCVADNLQASVPFMEAAGAKYSWASLGLLSPILSQPGMVGLRRSKDTLSQPERSSLLPDNVVLTYLAPQGLSGLSLQPAKIAPTVILAAKAGMIWRQPPGHYPQVALS